MDKNLLVKVFVPHQGTSGKGSVATGYPVAHGLVLTVRHVLTGKDRDLEKPIEISWYHQKGEAGEPRLAAGVAWQGEGALDAALIRCPFPNEVPGVGQLSGDKEFNTGTKWESEGFPRIGMRGGVSREAIPMMGEIFSAADSQTHLQLGHSYGTDLPEDWKGISGGPVFVGGVIVGVLALASERFKGNRLKAVRCKKLLEDKKFKRLVSEEERKAFIKQARNEIAATLKDAKAAYECLVDELNAEIPRSQKEHEHEYIASLLIEQGRKSLEIAKRVHDAQRKKKDETGIEALRITIKWLAPLVMDLGSVLAGNKLDPTDKVQSPPVATETGLEIAMAAWDGRAMNFHPPVKGAIYPVGKGSWNKKYRKKKTEEETENEVEIETETGFSGGKEDYLKLWRERLLNEFGNKAFERFGEEYVNKIINVGLQDKSRLGESPYFYFTEKIDGDSAYHQLAEMYPWLMIVALSDDGRIAVREAQEIISILNILFPDVMKEKQ